MSYALLIEPEHLDTYKKQYIKYMYITYSSTSWCPLKSSFLQRTLYVFLNDLWEKKNMMFSFDSIGHLPYKTPLFNSLYRAKN